MWFVIRLLLLGLWVGALSGFAFIFAPTAFAHVGPTPAFAATIAASIRLMTRVGDWCAILAAGITAFAQLERPRRAALIVALLAIAVGLGFVVTNVIVPQMETTPLQTPAYDALHHKSSTLYSGVLLAGLVSFVLCATSSRRAYK